MKLTFLYFFAFFCLPLFAQKNTNLPVFSFRQPASDAALHISEFIDLLRQEEAKYPMHEQYNTRLMLTRLRKLFYGSPAWDKHLIKGVTEIKNGYENTLEVPVDKMDKLIKTPIGLKIRLIDAITYPVNKKGEIPLLRKNILRTQEISLEKGRFQGMVFDIGHVLCALDALNHPSEVRTRFRRIPTSTLRIRSNADAVTWIGDLGSVMAESFFARYQKKEAWTMARIVETCAPPADQLGNIDAYLLYDMYDFNKEKGQKISDILTDFYLLSPEKQAKRFSFFVKKIGLDWDGKDFLNEKKALHRYRDEINDSATFYTLISAKNIGKKNFIKAIPLAARISISHRSEAIVAAFFQALKEELKKE